MTKRARYRNYTILFFVLALLAQCYVPQQIRGVAVLFLAIGAGRNLADWDDERIKEKLAGQARDSGSQDGKVPRGTKAG